MKTAEATAWCSALVFDPKDMAFVCWDVRFCLGILGGFSCPNNGHVHPPSSPMRPRECVRDATSLPKPNQIWAVRESTVGVRPLVCRPPPPKHVCRGVPPGRETAVARPRKCAPPPCIFFFGAAKAAPPPPVRDTCARVGALPADDTLHACFLPEVREFIL